MRDEPIRPGYKRTEVGIIPEDWGTKNLSEISTVVRGGSPRPAGDPRYFNGHYIPWLTVAALTNRSDSHLYVSETDTCLTEEGAKYSRTLQPGTLIIANSGATLGVAKILEITCCANDGIAALINQSEGEKRFICYYLNTRTRYLREVVATGNGQPNLNTSLIGNISVPLPSMHEQTAIADVLSDVDALLDALERLIAKKRAIKQGAMQVLLTGRVRLSRFERQPAYKQTEVGMIPEDWELKKFGEVVERIIGGGTPERQNASYWNGKIPWITVKDLATFSPRSSQETITREGLLNSATNLIPASTLIISTRITLGIPVIYAIDVAINQDLKAIFPKEYVAPWYLFYWFKQQTDKIREMGGGSTVLGISLVDLRKLEFICPPVSEQTAIAEILSDMDAEIDALVKRRAKLRAIKQGMMQELLTGHIRLMHPQKQAQEAHV